MLTYLLLHLMQEVCTTERKKKLNLHMCLMIIKQVSEENRARLGGFYCNQKRTVQHRPTDLHRTSSEDVRTEGCKTDNTNSFA